jgi:hypothetical protein
MEFICTAKEKSNPSIFRTQIGEIITIIMIMIIIIIAIIII